MVSPGLSVNYKYADAHNDDIEYQDEAQDVTYFRYQETGSYGQDEQSIGNYKNYLSHMNNI